MTSRGNNSILCSHVPIITGRYYDVLLGSRLFVCSRVWSGGEQDLSFKMNASGSGFAEISLQKQSLLRRWHQQYAFCDDDDDDDDDDIHLYSVVTPCYYSIIGALRIQYNIQ